MQLFTYKKEGLSDLELFVDRTNTQGQFFLCDFRSDSLNEWEALGFNWKVGDRFLGEATALADVTEADLYMFEGDTEVGTYVSSKSVSIQVSVEPEDAGTVTPQPVTGKTGDVVSIKATPIESKSFEKWVIDGDESTDNPKSITLKEDMEIRAVFGVKKLTVTVTSEDDAKGTVTGGGSVEYDTDVTVKATRKTGWKFTGWYEGGDLVSSDQSYTFKVTSDRTLVAKWSQYDISIIPVIEPVGGGRVPPNPVAGQEGTTVGVTATPGKGYNFVKFTIDSADKEENPVDVTMVESLSSVKCVKGDGIASLTTEGGTVVYGGSGPIVTATVSEGYTFDGWYDGDTKVGSDLQFQPTNITADKTFTAKATPTATE